MEGYKIGLTAEQKANYRASLVKQGLSGRELERRYNRWLRAMDETRMFGPLGHLRLDAERIRESLFSTAFRGGLAMPKFTPTEGRPPLTQEEVITEKVEALMGRVFREPEELARKARDELKRMASRLGAPL